MKVQTPQQSNMNITDLDDPQPINDGSSLNLNIHPTTTQALDRLESSLRYNDNDSNVSSLQHHLL